MKSKTMKSRFAILFALVLMFSFSVMPMSAFAADADNDVEPSLEANIADDNDLAATEADAEAAIGNAGQEIEAISAEVEQDWDNAGTAAGNELARAEEEVKEMDWDWLWWLLPLLALAALAWWWFTRKKVVVDEVVVDDIKVVKDDDDRC